MRRLPFIGVSLLVAGVAWTAGSAAGDAAASTRVGMIAFIRLEPGRVFRDRLFVVRPDGSGLRPVTPPGTTTWGYAWSPDGSLIAYIDQRGSLWLVRPDGSGRRLLLPASRLSSGVALSWSPDGKEIAIASGRNGDSDACPGPLYVVPVDGGPPVSLHALACDVAWSPRGDQIAYSRGGQVFVIPRDGTGGWGRDVAPADVGEGGTQWSADGSQLAFVVRIHGRNAIADMYSAFAVVDADGTHFHVVTTHAYTEYPVAWSPQGRRILYGRADNEGIYVIDPDSSHNHRITRDSPPQALWPALAWSPNGGSIVYDAGTSSNTNVYVIGTDGRDKVQLTNTPGIYIEPTWAAG
jgi:Tol biopolymer transport system component